MSINVTYNNGYFKSHWRARFAPIISKVLEETKGQTAEQIRKALHDAYPLTERSHDRYKIWLDEIKRQKGRPVKFIEPGTKLVFPNAPIGAKA